MAKHAQIITITTKAVKKNGKLKAKNKKERKKLLAACPHCIINKKGKIKPMIHTVDKNYCECIICGKGFPGEFFTNEYVKEAIKRLSEIVQQAKFIAAVSNAGDRVLNFLCKFQYMLNRLFKVYKNLRNSAKKSSQLKHGGKKDNSGNGSQAYGGWNYDRKHNW